MLSDCIARNGRSNHVQVNGVVVSAVKQGIHADTPLPVIAGTARLSHGNLRKIMIRLGL